LDCAYTLIIAPEFGDYLLTKTRRAAQRGAALLSPAPKLISLASDKCTASSWLRNAGIRVPETARCRSIDQVPGTITWPAILKPICGAGSQNVRCVTRREAAGLLTGAREFCVQQYCAGRPASVAAICGPAQQILLPPCWQHLDARTYAYRGGSRINELSFVRRAQSLAEQVLDSLPCAHGYLGIDLVLGPAEDGSSDYVIEVNPRLTTSYIGLRAMAHQNLAAAMLDLSASTPVTLSFTDEPLEFEPDGRIRDNPSFDDWSKIDVKDPE
jgi:predicted ATP-grasp superfamily ATP-dependent carboligase